MSLSFIKTWIFDLDNTLYPPEENIFSQIDEKMTSFIAENLKISHEEAFNIQKQNFIDHGTTLAGFMNTGNNKINHNQLEKIIFNWYARKYGLKKVRAGFFKVSEPTEPHIDQILTMSDLRNEYSDIKFPPVDA